MVSTVISRRDADRVGILDTGEPNKLQSISMVGSIESENGSVDTIFAIEIDIRKLMRSDCRHIYVQD